MVNLIYRLPYMYLYHIFSILLNDLSLPMLLNDPLLLFLHMLLYSLYIIRFFVHLYLTRYGDDYLRTNCLCLLLNPHDLRNLMDELGLPRNEGFNLLYEFLTFFILFYFDILIIFQLPWSMATIPNWTPPHCWTSTGLRFINPWSAVFNGLSRLDDSTSGQRPWQCHGFAHSRDRVTWIAWNASLDTYPRCVTLWSASARRRWISPTCRVRSLTGNIPSMMAIRRKRFPQICPLHAASGSWRRRSSMPTSTTT